MLKKTTFTNDDQRNIGDTPGVSGGPFLEVERS